MKTAAVRTGSLLVGVAGLLAIPGVASGQIDVGKTVGEAVGEVGKAVPQVVPQAAPAPVPAAPVPAPAQPAPRQTAPSAPAAPAPAPSSGGGESTAGSSAGGSASAGGGSASRSSAAAPAPTGGGAKAKAASSGNAKRAGKVTVLAGTQSNGALDPSEGESFSGAVTTSPNTGVQGDPELPFTGFSVLLLAAMGAAVLAGGMALRTAARRRHAA
jgi:hypothetical protein